jgi:Tol biopolymer transport system component
MNAILKEDPPEMSVAGDVPLPALEGIVRHCLEKSPEERFQSARDLAFALGSAGVSSGAVAVGGPARAARRPRATALLVAVLGAAALAGVAFVFGRRTAPVSSPSFEPLTFRYGTVLSARFAPDGQTVAYGASWEGKPAEVFTQRPGSPEARSLGLSGADLLAISGSGEMALSLHNHRIDVFRSTGTLGQAPLSGGAPREILKDVFYADWSPDAKSLAVVRLVQGRSRLEFPIGKTLYETAGWISHPRFSPKGDAIAFLDHSEQGTDFGSVTVVDLAGRKKKLTGDWGSVEGLAWSASGEEIWFTASETFYRALRAVDRSGRTRLIARTAGNLTLLDVSRAGRALVNRENWRGILVASAAGGPERDLSWLDTTVVTDISADGKTLLFGEMGEAGGARSAAYLRSMDGSPAVRLGDGVPTALSPDGTRVLTILHGATSRLLVVPTGAGQAGEIAPGPIVGYHWATFFPDGLRVLFAGNEAGHGARLYVQSLSGGSPRAVSAEGIRVFVGGLAIAPDGSQAAAVGPDERIWLYPLGKGGDGRPLPGLAVGYIPVRWAADGRSLFVFRPRELPARVLRVSSEDGRSELWKSLMPSDPAGVTVITPLVISPDGKSYAYTFARSLSDLYLVDGWK